ncbi:DUF3306 domain-containing protein [Roseovarius ramblicola]|uniref:DUF3306 domain-containing protein n=1 Tax=Roseovarius ramblicola TaxID=2022336 RepID=A0ABV5HZ41_9RHOB
MTRTVTEAADFWSRRKARVAAEDAAEARAAEAQVGAAQEAALAEKSDAEICEELGLPDPDTLEAGGDFRAFMDRAVPERLRRRALRRLWLSNPALANLDGMVDYGEDFTDSACVIEGMQTAYQVGKGMLAHVREMARQAEAEAVADAGDEAPGSMALTEAEAEAEPEAQAAPEDAAAPPEGAPAEAVAQAGDDAPPPPRRRMRFDFAGADGEQA